MARAPHRAEFIKTKRGGLLLCHEGFQYHRTGRRADTIYWICSKRPECSARAITKGPPPDDARVTKAGDHIHAPNREETAARAVVNDMKDVAARHPEMPPANIIREGLADVDDEVLSQLPQRVSLKRAINRKRQADLPRNPIALGDIRELPEEYQKTLGGEQFLLYDSRDYRDGSESGSESGLEDEPPRVMVFATKEALRKLGKSDIWFVDGTFKVSPVLFVQVFTIHGLYKNEALPLVFALLTGKAEPLYIEVLQALKDKAAEFHVPFPEPTTIVSDFELAIINACRKVLPHAILRLCFFHLGQSVYRKVQNLGLAVLYNDPADRQYKVAVHQLLSLAFVPAEDVKDVFAELRPELPRQLRTLADYFEETYVGERPRRLRGNRQPRPKPPRYAVEDWNQHNAALQDEPRTNNTTEGWHNRFQGMVGKSHPSFYHLLREFRKEEKDTEVMMRELQMGRRIKAPRRTKYIAVNKRLQGAAMDYQEYKEEGRVLEYLTRCGNNFSL
ncbi:FLYWCH-type zinc finger-containing protein 1 [Frankliniella fusca]|uniref:FLYWCH-type zinc finger-containing protein 1 n=1 Tax=Frankliniella fusca TaxID=407009 RepID=A0AAE1HER2_9NEOP|nr:FLYWCH-type zinc finger-containing protein 1 [Frankliniella fusca]